MKSGFDYHSEDLVKSANRLLKELDEFADLRKSLLGEETEKSRAAAETPVLTTDRTDSAQTGDGRVEIRVSEDGMSAFGHLYPARGEGRKPTSEMIRERLREEGVVFGIDWELAEEAVLQCVTGKKHVADVPLARGKAPKDEVPAHPELTPKFGSPPKPAEDSNLRIDHKERTPFAVVSEGETLAREIPREAGEEGSTVYGNPISYGIRRVPELRPGLNTERVGDEIRSTKDGRLIVQGNDFFVQEVLEIKGDVDYATGNIHFGGDVVVHGTVQEGFLIETGGSLFCKNSLDATQVLCGRDLIVTGGIIGKKKGLVRVSGLVKSRFIEHCFLEAKGSVFAEKAILHSVIRSASAVELGKKGTIIGGRIYAKDGIVTAQLGSDMGAKTELRLGVDPEAERKLLWFRKKIEEMNQKLQEIRNRLVQKPDDSELFSIKEKLTLQTAAAGKTAADLAAGLETNPEAAATATGLVFPGVTVEILDSRMTVTQVLKNVRFSRDREKNQIVVTPL